MAKHQKHAKLKLRDNDTFAPNEIAIVGTKCDVISNLVQQVSEKLTNRLTFIFIDIMCGVKNRNSVEVYSCQCKLPLSGA